VAKKFEFKIGDKVKCTFDTFDGEGEEEVEIFYGRVVSRKKAAEGVNMYTVENNDTQITCYDIDMEHLTLFTVQQDIKDLRKKIDNIISVALG
jgi:hypothetical protein